MTVMMRYNVLFCNLSVTAYLTSVRAEIPVNPTPADLAREAAMNRANAPDGAGEENPVLEEVRLLAEAVQGHQSRAGSSRESDTDGDSSNLPCFFRVTGNCAVDVRTAPNNSSPCVRSLNEVGDRNLFSFIDTSWC
jgi:hypothetical protein